MLGTMGHRWLVAQFGTSTVPRPKAIDSERMNLQYRGAHKPECLETSVPAIGRAQLCSNGDTGAETAAGSAWEGEERRVTLYAETGPQAR